MSEEQQQLWNKQEGEPSIWYRRFERYLLMFPRRSVAAAYHEEHPELETEKKREKESDFKPSGRWYEMAKQWRWEERAEAWDAAQFAEEEKIKVRVMRSGFALQHNRMLMLQDQLNKLLAMTENEDRIWIPDVKAIGNGPEAERVDLVQFNGELFKEIREFATDIAEEMGERVKRKEVAITSLPPDIYEGIGPDDDGTEL